MFRQSPKTRLARNLSPRTPSERCARFENIARLCRTNAERRHTSGKYIALYAVNSPTRFNGGISRSFVLKDKNLWCKTRIRSVCPCTADFPISHNSWLRENIVLAPCNVFLQRFVEKKKMYRPFLNKQVCARADERETPAATRRPKGFTTVVICGHV